MSANRKIQSIRTSQALMFQQYRESKQKVEAVTWKCPNAECSILNSVDEEICERCDAPKREEEEELDSLQEKFKESLALNA